MQSAYNAVAEFVFLKWTNASESVDAAKKFLDKMYPAVFHNPHAHEGGGPHSFAYWRIVEKHFANFRRFCSLSGKISAKMDIVCSFRFKNVVRFLIFLHLQAENAMRGILKLDPKTESQFDEQLIELWESILFDADSTPSPFRRPSRTKLVALYRVTRRACTFLVLPLLKNAFDPNIIGPKAPIRGVVDAFVRGTTPQTEWRRNPPDDEGVADIRKLYRDRIKVSYEKLTVRNSQWKLWPIWARFLLIRLQSPMAELCAVAASAAIGVKVPAEQVSDILKRIYSIDEGIAEDSIRSLCEKLKIVV